jgi:predicted DNA binding CopG/RHH family protein
MAKSQTKASAKYNAKTYEEIKLRVKIGQKDNIKTYAESKGMSLNGYINNLIENDMKKNE